MISLYSRWTKSLALSICKIFVYLILGYSPASNFYMPTYRNTLSVPASKFFVFTPPMKMEQIKCSETSEYKTLTPDNNPKLRTQHAERGESLKSTIMFVLHCWYTPWLWLQYFNYLPINTTNINKKWQYLVVNRTTCFGCF